MLDRDSAGCYNRNVVAFNLLIVHIGTTDDHDDDDAHKVYQTRGRDVFAK